MIDLKALNEWVLEEIVGNFSKSEVKIDEKFKIVIKKKLSEEYHDDIFAHQNCVKKALEHAQEHI